MASKPAFDILTTDCAELQGLLAAHKTTSVDIVEAHLAQIERHNSNGLNLNAIITTTPRDVLLSIARRLDEERAQGAIRSPLHGIPITIKDNIMTGPEFQMPTSVGSAALKSAVAQKNAPVVDMLVKAGAIIIGKANLSEMAGWKGFGITTGWSAVGGQTQSPYIIGGVKPGEKLLGHTTPAGSSSGSAAGVAAGFSPLALATETDGSIVQPANRASLYGLKATVGLIPTEGTAPWSSLTDSIGGMARTPQDLAALLGILLNDTDFSDSLTGSWEGQRVGFVDPTLWTFVPFICDPDPVLIEQQHRALADAADIIAKSAGTVEQPVPLTSMDELVLDGEDALDQLWNHDFEKAWNVYLTGYKDTDIKSLVDIVEFNKKNPDIALPSAYPGQQLLEGALKDTLSDEIYALGVKTIRDAARVNGIDKTLSEFDLDVIIGPMDGRIPTIAAAAGYPVGTMPLGYSSTNGRAFGACIITGAGQEDKILKAMSAWHVTMTKRKPPPQLL
ncbi:amidase signature domain-containing protein [Lasiosphaeria ovina]|uniref:Amidase signature domain-containing protein n=1 Tax=Lasiosphaeria ovina TaxID=92902 RepID=A0AAE0N1G3_9PEZI|nr:amidase signature domain-containing protein [Lasiosphaeria ovina]